MTRLVAPLVLALAAAAAAQQGPPAPPPTGALERRADALAADEERLARELLAARRARADLAARAAELEAVAGEDGPERGRLTAAYAAARERCRELLEGERAARRDALQEEVVARFEALVADVEAALGVRPDDVGLRRVRARLLASKNRLGRAREDAFAVLMADPADPVALRILGKAAVAENRFEDARALFERALEVEPGDAGRAYLAIACYALNDFTDARRARDAVEDPDGLPAELQLRWGWWLAELEERERAWADELARRRREVARGDLPRVAFAVDGRGEVVVELFEDTAPNAAAAVVELVADGFYEGLAFHRVVPGSLAQVGDPATRPGAADTPPPAWRLPDEDGPDRRHFRGTVSLAGGEGPDATTTQLIFTVRPAPLLDGRHTVVGRVVAGLEVVDAVEPDDRVTTTRVVRQRDHPYVAEKVRAR